MSFAENEHDRHQTSEDDQTDHLRRAPWKGRAPEIETQQQHYSESQDREASVPVNGSHTILEFCTRVMDIKEEKQE